MTYPEATDTINPLDLLSPAELRQKLEEAKADSVHAEEFERALETRSYQLGIIKTEEMRRLTELPDPSELKIVSTSSYSFLAGAGIHGIASWGPSEKHPFDKARFHEILEIARRYYPSPQPQPIK